METFTIFAETNYKEKKEDVFILKKYEKEENKKDTKELIFRIKQRKTGSVLEQLNKTAHNRIKDLFPKVETTEFIKNIFDYVSKKEPKDIYLNSEKKLVCIYEIEIQTHPK